MHCRIEFASRATRQTWRWYALPVVFQFLNLIVPPLFVDFLASPSQADVTFTSSATQNGGTLTVSPAGNLTIDGSNPILSLINGATTFGVNDLSVGLDNRGSLTVSGLSVVTNSGEGILARNVGSTGTVTITGVGSQWNASNDLYVAINGNGSLFVSGGGKVTSSQVFLGHGAAGTGTATITGEGSAWTVTNGFYVGGSSTASGGIGRLTITGGGRIDVGGLTKIWSTGTLTLGVGGNLTTASLEGDGAIANGGSLVVNGNGSNTIYSGSISGLGSLQKLGAGSLTLGGLNTYTGPTTVSGGGKLTIAQGSSCNSALRPTPTSAIDWSSTARPPRSTVSPASCSISKRPPV